MGYPEFKNKLIILILVWDVEDSQRNYLLKIGTNLIKPKEYTSNILFK